MSKLEPPYKAKASAPVRSGEALYYQDGTLMYRDPKTGVVTSPGRKKIRGKRERRQFKKLLRLKKLLLQQNKEVDNVND